MVFFMTMNITIIIIRLATQSVTSSQQFLVIFYRSGNDFQQKFCQKYIIISMYTFFSIILNLNNIHDLIFKVLNIYKMQDVMCNVSQQMRKDPGITIWMLSIFEPNEIPFGLEYRKKKSKLNLKRNEDLVYFM